MLSLIGKHYVMMNFAPFCPPWSSATVETGLTCIFTRQLPESLCSILFVFFLLAHTQSNKYVSNHHSQLKFFAYLSALFLVQILTAMVELDFAKGFIIPRRQISAGDRTFVRQI